MSVYVTETNLAGSAMQSTIQAEKQLVCVPTYDKQGSQTAEKQMRLY